MNWIGDMFLDCILPGKRIFEERNINQVVKKSPIPTSLSILNFIIFVDWVLSN